MITIWNGINFEVQETVQSLVVFTEIAVLFCAKMTQGALKDSESLLFLFMTPVFHLKLKMYLYFCVSMYKHTYSLQNIYFFNLCCIKTFLLRQLLTYPYSWNVLQWCFLLIPNSHIFLKNSSHFLFKLIKYTHNVWAAIFLMLF